MRALSEARRHAEARDLVAALPHVLDAWRTCPSPDLAACIARITAELPDGTASVETLLAAPDPVGFPTIRRWLDGSPNSPALRRNLLTLAGVWPEDPRLVDWLLAFFEAPPWDLVQGNPAELARTVVGMLAASRDPRVEVWVRDLPAFFEAHRGTRKGQLSRDEITTLDQMFRGVGLVPGEGRSAPVRCPDLPADDVADLSAIEAVLAGLDARGRGDAERLATLLQAVVSAWDDDGPKRVYADALQELGDPQGELIHLELAGSSDPRVQVLRREVAGRIGVPASAWEKGFPRAVRLWGKEGPTSTWTEEPAWGTVVSADMPPSSDACATAHLRELRVAASYLKDLAALTRPLGVTHLTLPRISAKVRSTLKKVRVLPTVRTLTLEGPADEDFGWVFDVPWLQGLTELRLAAYAPEKLATLTAFARAAFQKTATSRRIVVADLEGGERIVVTRDGDRVALTLSAPNERVVEALARGFAGTPRPGTTSRSSAPYRISRAWTGSGPDRPSSVAWPRARASRSMGSSCASVLPPGPTCSTPPPWTPPWRASPRVRPASRRPPSTSPGCPATSPPPTGTG